MLENDKIIFICPSCRTRYSLPNLEEVDFKCSTAKCVYSTKIISVESVDIAIVDKV